MPGWLLRLLLSVGIFLLAFGFYRLLAGRSMRAAIQAHGLPFQQKEGKKTLIYFSTPDCAVCRGAQKPALDQLKSAMGGDLEIIEINAYEQEGIAREWGVLSVPATILLDEDGTALAFNYGLAPFKKLNKQFNGG